MKMKHNYFVLVFAFISFVVSLIAVINLPDVVVIHWNMNGEADGYGSKYFYLFFGALGFLSYFLMGLTKNIDPNQKKIDKNLNAYATIRDIISIMLSMMSLISIFSIFMKNFNVSMLVCVIMGVFMIALGNYMPRVPHNYFMGIKTPWAIADEKNWKKTQRMGGYSLVFGGALMAIAGLFNWKILMAVAFAEILISIAVVYVYSWYIYRHE